MHTWLENYLKMHKESSGKKRDCKVSEFGSKRIGQLKRQKLHAGHGEKRQVYALLYILPIFPFIVLTFSQIILMCKKINVNKPIEVNGLFLNLRKRHVLKVSWSYQSIIQKSTQFLDIPFVLASELTARIFFECFCDGINVQGGTTCFLLRIQS